MIIKEITSAENPIIKNFRKLYKGKYREKEKLFIIEGPTLIEEALRSKIELQNIFLRNSDEIPKFILSDINDINYQKVYSLPAGLFDKIVDTDTPQGVVATAKMPDMDREDFYDISENILILDRIQDPGNIGTILRTAEAAGFYGIISMKGTADLFSPKIVRAAAGSLNRLKIKHEEDPIHVIHEMKVHGISSICTSPHEGLPYFSIDLKKRIGLIIGNEAGGACDEFMRLSELKITLPMKGENESLNAAVAAAIIMYETLRQNLV